MDTTDGLIELWEKLKKTINSTRIEDIKVIHWKEDIYGNEILISTNSTLETPMEVKYDKQ